MFRFLQPLLGQSLRVLGMVLPLGLLAGLGLWGFCNDWKIKKFSDLWGASEKSETDPAGAEDDTPLPIDERPPQESPLVDLWATGFQIQPATPWIVALHSYRLSKIGGEPLKRIEFPSLAVLRKAGVKLARVEERPMVERVLAYGVLDYDQTRYAHLSTRAPGIVWRVLKTYGDQVKEGEVLAIIDAAELGKAKADFLLDLVQLSVRTRNLQQLQAAPASMPERQVRDAESAVRETRIRLFNDRQALINLGLELRIEDLSNMPDQQAARQVRLLGLPPEVLKRLDPDTLPATLLPMKAPFDGIVVNRELVIGEQVVASHESPQFVLADVRNLSILLDVRLEDIGRVAVGQEIVFRPDGGSEDFSGKLAWLSVEADSKTRTVKARAELKNPDGRLRPQTFGNATIQVRNSTHSLVVPSDAIQSDGKNPILFVQVSERTFEPRRVQLGIKEGEFTEILKGVLRAGELVVHAGSHVLKAELFKDRIGGAE